jgi:glycosyltransferase involved in cell wall biosynthesis
MKIVFLTRFFWPHIGGVEKHVEEVSHELAKKGHQITILTLKHEPNLANIEERRGIKIIRLPYSNNKFTIWREIWGRRNLIRQADIIHCHDVFFWYLPWRFIYLNKPVYITFHGWEGEYPVPFRNKLVRKLWEKLSRGNICVGAYLKKWYGTNPDYITYGAITFRYAGRHSQTLSGKRERCVFVGRLEKDLAIKDYLQILASVKKRYGLEIIFVGDGQYAKQAKKIGRVTGFVPDIVPYLKKPVYVFSASYLTILQAMALGQPVFALYQNELKKDYLQQFPGASYLNIAGSASDLLTQFESAFRQPQSLSQTLNQGQKFAQAQTWGKLAQFYLKLWQI